MIRHTASMNGVAFFAFAVIVAALPHESVFSCDTPVYRYAMYRWSPTPYELYYFHEDFWQEQEYNVNDTAIHETLERMAEDVAAPANVILLPVNTFVDQKLRSVPPDVRKHWVALEDKSLPKYMLVSPQGARVFSGNLSLGQLESLVSSPARQQISDLLADGRSGVFLLLGGNDSAANDAAEKVLNELAADVAAEKVDLYMAPKPAVGAPAAFPQKPEVADAESEKEVAASDDSIESPPPHQIGVVRLERNDPKEHWLVETLLTVEPDLKDEEFKDEPMVFVVYGRGRALPPYIGKGITKTNMLDVLNFITSACSCTVKEQNPGVDLLTRYDWETAAEKLAERFGTEEGNEGFYAPDEFFPELIVGSGNQADKRTSDVVGQQPAEVSRVDPVNADTPDAAGTSKSDSTEDSSRPKVEDGGDKRSMIDALKPVSPTANNGDANRAKPDNSEVAALDTDRSSVTAESKRSDRDTNGTNSWMYTLAIGIGIGLFMLIGASFVLFKNR